MPAAPLQRAPGACACGGGCPRCVGGTGELQRKPIAVTGRARRRWLQRHPIYISRHGSQAHLDNAADFFRQWGYTPITTGVDSIEQVVRDLATKSSIGQVTLVSHAHPDAVMMSMLDGGPGTVPESDWRVDLREEPQIDLDAPLGGGSTAVLPADPEEVVDLERHFLRRPAVTTAIRNARRDETHRDALNRIGADSDPAVMQYLWWTVERQWLPQSGFSRSDQRRIRAAIDRHLDAWKQAIRTRATSGGGTAPGDADFAAIPAAIRHGMDPMSLDPVQAAQRADVMEQLIESPSAPAARVLLNPEFSRNLERVRGRMTAQSYIEIQGCRAGQSQSYLRAIQDFFGHGAVRPRVTGPDWFQGYGNLGWSPVATSLDALRRQLRNRHVARALEHWYPIIMGGEMQEDADRAEMLRDYLNGPNVLPVSYPGHTLSPGRSGSMLIARGTESDAYLRWLSRHSYRLSSVDDISAALFDPDRTAAQNIDAAKVDYMQEDRNLPSRIVYRPDPAYANHIISA